MNIVLTGMMGSGKTTAGRMLAEKLGMNFFDMDKDIERTAGMKINRIFREKGEAEFRKIERSLVQCVSLLDNYVISTGGGVVLDKKNMADFRKNGKIFYLKAKPEVLYERVRRKKNRPLLKVEDPLIEMRKIYNKRKKRYADCDYAVETAGKSTEKICGEIMSLIGRKKCIKSIRE